MPKLAIFLAAPSADDDHGFGPVIFIIGIAILFGSIGVWQFWMRMREKRQRKAAGEEMAKRQQMWMYK